MSISDLWNWISCLKQRVDEGMIVKPSRDGKYDVSVQAGAGIVADSLPENEYQETINKAKGILKALACLDK